MEAAGDGAEKRDSNRKLHIHCDSLSGLNSTRQPKTVLWFSSGGLVDLATEQHALFAR